MREFIDIYTGVYKLPSRTSASAKAINKHLNLEAIPRDLSTNVDDREKWRTGTILLIQKTALKRPRCAFISKLLIIYVVVKLKLTSVLWYSE